MNKKSVAILSALSIGHFVLTVVVSLLAWGVREKNVAGLLSEPIRVILSWLSMGLNFPIPFLLRNNSLLIMFCNSILFSIIIIALMKRLRKNNTS